IIKSYPLGRCLLLVCHAIAIGNGSNDVEMLKKAKLGIAVIGREGCACDALKAADIVMNSSADALDLLINSNRLIATLRR
ncbi:MAG: HAD hydrolase family protein, partial [Actinobacteria bacterium]|nr:HAD hydrolase family protein [Actinomycetota bacterium]